MARMTLRSKGQLTLPDEVRRAARLEEGDVLDAEITADGILLRPHKLVDITQAWFWEPAWQELEREAEEDRVNGRIEAFDSGEAMLAELRSIAKPSKRRTR